MHKIIEDNIAVLKQGIQLLGRIDNTLYNQPSPQCFSSKIGGHIRHNIDHYLSFIDSYSTGELNYDQRDRDPLIENELSIACEKMFEIIKRLSDVSTVDLNNPLKVKMDTNCDEDSESEWSQSTVLRELQFLLSHTIHHYALMAVICRLQNVKIDAEFGVAPSTIRYQKSQAQCAQ